MKQNAALQAEVKEGSKPNLEGVPMCLCQTVMRMKCKKITQVFFNQRKIDPVVPATF